jgi:hypothetical protein
LHFRAIRSVIACDSSVAFRVGGVTGDKGYITEFSAEVNRLPPKNLEIFAIERVSSWGFS